MLRTRISFSLLVVLLLLAFTFTPAAAGSQPPGNLPPPTDFAPPDPAQFSPLADDYIPTLNIGVDAVNPAPIAPNLNNVYTRTPKFTFTPRSGASQYHLVVVDTMAAVDTLVYHFYGSATCNDLICTMQPANLLKTYRYQVTSGGTYYWMVEAMVGGLWEGLSAPAQFAVYSSGFNSTFNVDTSKWRALNGTWERNTAGYYKTLGVTGQIASALQKEFFANDYVYEVTMKHKVEDTLNRIFFHSYPSLVGTDKHWSRGYIFGYYNTGTWVLERQDANGNNTILASAASPFIRKYGWNTLTVWTDYPYIHMWINGAYLSYVKDETYLGGFVGVGMMETDPLISPLLVDSATLTYSAIAPYAITGVELGEPLHIASDGLHE